MDAFADLKSEFVEQTWSENFDDPAHLIWTRRVAQSSHCSSGSNASKQRAATACRFQSAGGRKRGGGNSVVDDPDSSAGDVCQNNFPGAGGAAIDTCIHIGSEHRRFSLKTLQHRHRPF